ncbi:hypothetical protein MSPP1_003426 [Malassezia sp. CBS 17886]|nr:hypothetical protein MSPP1_003426 [Malassezia sp. CBS 17886]
MASTAAAPRITTASARSAGAKPEAGSAIEGAALRCSRREEHKYDSKDLHQYMVPEFSVKDLLSAIPRHCFERSTLRSSMYVLGDFAQAALLVYGATWIDTLAGMVHLSFAFVSEAAVQTAVRYALWAMYGFVQGLVFTGIWVIAHECGHQAFSPSKTINNTVGWVLHSALLVPYHSWRISHGRHHAGTGHILRDEVFVPRTRDDMGKLPLRPHGTPPAPDSLSWGEWLADVLEDAPLFVLFELLLKQLIGWPLYLLFNTSGQTHFPPNTNHFSPNSVIFDKRHRNQILISDVGIGCTFAALCAWAALSPGGWKEVAKYYIVPYFWTNNWLVMITYLQHTDPKLPHYDADTWTFPRGALSTIDRQWLGPVGAHFFHGISETHVSHHISSKIPHYHAWDATEALKRRLGQHYMKSDENVLAALWRCQRSCRFVVHEPVAFYRNAHGVPGSVPVFAGSGTDSGVALSE